MNHANDDLLKDLKAAVDGLLYPSESDEPFEVFAWPLADGKTAKEAVTNHTNGKQPTAEQSADEFFAALSETDDADRYADLRRLLEGRLKGLAILRVGDTQVGVYLIGKAGGRWVGLQTCSIET